MANIPVTKLHLIDPPSFYARVLTAADIGFVEAYIAGDFTIDTLDQLLNIFHFLILNRGEEERSSGTDPSRNQCQLGFSLAEQKHLTRIETKQLRTLRSFQ